MNKPLLISPAPLFRKFVLRCCVVALAFPPPVFASGFGNRRPDFGEDEYGASSSASRVSTAAASSVRGADSVSTDPAPPPPAPSSSARGGSSAASSPSPVLSAPAAAAAAASSSTAVTKVPRSLGDGVEIPKIARGYEEVYRRFFGGKLIYRPDPKSDAGMIELKIADLANPLEGTFDLSRCGDTGKYLSISTGYRKGKIPANKDKVEIWFTPWFVADAVKAELPQNHYLRAVTTPDTWDGARAQVGIFWTWGNWANLSDVDYLTTQNMGELGSENLYEKWELERTRRRARGGGGGHDAARRFFMSF